MTVAMEDKPELSERRCVGVEEKLKPAGRISRVDILRVWHVMALGPGPCDAHLLLENEMKQK